GGGGRVEGAEGNEGNGAAKPDKVERDNLVGRINTLVTVDVDNILNAKGFLFVVIQVPLELALALVFLYKVLGWSALVGFASMILVSPLPSLLAQRIQDIQAQKLKRACHDARVEAVTETVGVLRMIKLFGWERKMSDVIKEKREDELRWLWKDRIISLLNDDVNYVIPMLTMIITYATYSLIMKESLNASKVFSSMAVFDMIRGDLSRVSSMLVLMLKGLHLHTASDPRIIIDAIVVWLAGKVSLERIGDFLTSTELLDEFGGRNGHWSQVEGASPVNSSEDGPHTDVVGFNNAVFSWSGDPKEGGETPSSNSRAFRLRVEGLLTFKRGCINLIVGPTGAGKTSVLMALLGEMHFTPPAADSWYHLPREGGVAYAAQESWVQNETIRENILFGSRYDEERYRKVIEQCALKRDIELFEAGDLTEVGEKGLTLSGGQKARVTLARAIYSSAEVLLLDDILAALDVHTSKWIVEHCLAGDLVRGRTVLLVTHNVALTSPMASHIVSVDINGHVRDVGTDISAALKSDPLLAQEVEHEADEAELEKEVIDTIHKEDTVTKTDGKLVLDEEIIEGRVTWRSIMLFIKGLGGNHSLLFLGVWVCAMILLHSTDLFAVWFLGYWGSQYETHSPEDVASQYYIVGYTLILFTTVVIYTSETAGYLWGAMRASRVINAQLVESVLGSTFRWLDKTPAARIITRCTQDIAAVDGELASNFAAVVDYLIMTLVKLAGPVIFTPIFLLPGVVIGVVGVYLSNIYLKAQMSVKREMSNARSPVLSHFGAAIAGMVSIRAYGAQQSFKSESLHRIDRFIRIARTSYNLNRWIAIRIDLLAAVFTTGVVSYLLIRKNLNAANTGFSLKASLEFCSFILWLVRYYTNFEVCCNSLERIQSYLDIEHEPKSTKEGKPPAAWPKTGDLRVERLSARYSATGPNVLHELSFEVKSGERIGIVGRTGSGKSSLTLSLLRCIITEGTVYYDGLATDKVNLEDLRSSITIIPQIPELLSGTLRRNLDPFDQNDDLTLNNALRAAGLFSLQSESEEARLTLDSAIVNGGNNLSVAADFRRRQVVMVLSLTCRVNGDFAATSAIDHKTDSVIQSSLRTELGPDVTVLTVAHRLQTIMDADKIMVLDHGNMVEYDAPQALLTKKGGYFKALVDESGDRQALYAMAQRKGIDSAGRHL
ncbi:hypothetical protein CVT26_011497, partial [Gymnopilus dilepis]